MVLRLLLTLVIILTVTYSSKSLPTSPTHQRLGSDEIRITPLNRDVCLAKLLCGMSVVTLQDAYESGTKDGEIYGDYAQIVAKFFQENPPEDFDDDDGSLSQESVEAALEDYSVSTEDEDEDEIPVVQYRPKRPDKKKGHRVTKRPAAPTTAAAPVQVKKVPTPKPTPPGIQIFDLGMPVQENAAKPKGPKALFTSDPRLSRARKIMRRVGLATKLRTVRQCQRISGCTYTFKQLYQKYGGKGVIDEHSQPMQPLHVVDEQWSRVPQNGGKEPENKGSHVKGPLENPWISPSDTQATPPQPTAQMAFDVEYGGLNSKIPPGLEAYFQASLNGASQSTLTNPGTAYKIKKAQKQRLPPFAATVSKKQKRKKLTTTTEPPTTTTTTTTTEATTTTTTTTTTPPPPVTTTTPPRRLVHYKRPSKKKRPSGSDDDEDDDDNINETAPVKLIGHHEHDFNGETDHRHQPEGDDDDDDEDDDEERLNESQDDYDEEAKYNVPVDYGNDDETEEQDDDDDRSEPVAPKRRPKPPKQRPNADTVVQSDETSNQARPISPPKSKYKRRSQSKSKLDSDFDSGGQTGRPQKSKKKSKGKGSKDGSSEEGYDFEDEGPPPFEYPTHIGGRPIFPDYGIPVTAYGMTRSTMPAGKPPMPPQGSRPRPQKHKSKDDSEEGNTFRLQYNYPPPGSPHDHASEVRDPGNGYEPTSGMSVLSPIKSLFKHLSSGISPNPVGGSMGYTHNQSPSSLHYKMPPPPPNAEFGGGPPAPHGGSQGSPYPPPGITVPIKMDDAENPNVPQIAIMPQIPKGPESSEYKRPAKYTVNKSKRIPSL